VTKLTLHHLEESRSQRALWLLEELGVDYEFKRYSRTKAGRAPKELRDVHPLGKSPVVTNGDDVIAESGALVEYLLDTFGEGRFRPAADSDEWRTYRFFMHFAEGSMMPPLLVKLITGRLRKAIPLLGRMIASQIDGAFTDPENQRHLEFVESALEGRQWLAGELSGADIMMSFPVMAALSRAGVEGSFPNVSAYVSSIEARPAYTRALDRGGPLFHD